MIYVANPIDLADLDQRQFDIMNTGLELVLAACHSVYRPAGAFQTSATAIPNTTIASINQFVLMQCSGMLAFFPEERSIGVPMEIAFADYLCMPTLVVTSVAERSWSLAGLSHAKLVSGVSPIAAQWLADRANEFDAKRDQRAPLKVQGEPAYLPRRGHSDDAGFDLYVSADTEIPPGTSVDVPCGFNIQLPPGTFGLVVGRSSTLRKHGVMVELGVIDTGYRGPMYLLVHNPTSETFWAKYGTRLGQLIPLPNFAQRLEPVIVDQLDQSSRGQNGFGSTGQ